MRVVPKLSTILTIGISVSLAPPNEGIASSPPLYSFLIYASVATNSAKSLAVIFLVVTHTLLRDKNYFFG